VGLDSLVPDGRSSGNILSLFGCVFFRWYPIRDGVGITCFIVGGLGNRDPHGVVCWHAACCGLGWWAWPGFRCWANISGSTDGLPWSTLIVPIHRMLLGWHVCIGVQVAMLLALGNKETVERFVIVTLRYWISRCGRGTGRWAGILGARVDKFVDTVRWVGWQD